MTIGILNPALVGILAKGIKLTEDVTQPYVAATSPQITLSANVTEGEGAVTDSEGNSVTVNFGNPSASPASGWTSSGSTNPATFTRDMTGLLGSTPSVVSGSGAVDSFVDGSDGTAEIHTISAPINPGGGTWVCGGVETAYNATPVVSGWSFDRALSDGMVTATADAVEERSDTALAPNGTNLT